MPFFFKFLFGREPIPEVSSSAREPEDNDSERVFTNKMQEAVIILIKQSWAQYENVYFKLPERYFNKVKNYLWLVTLIVGAKIKLAVDLYVKVMAITNINIKDTMLYGFAVSSLLEIIIFLLCIIALNTKHQIVMALESPYTFLCSNNQHSYELLYNLLHQVEEGIKTCKTRIEKQNFFLGVTGAALFIDFCIILIIVACFFKAHQGS